MSRAHGCARVTMFRDERVVCVLLHKRHFRRPWRSYVIHALSPRMGCSRITQEQLSRMRRSDDVQDEPFAKLVKTRPNEATNWY